MLFSTDMYILVSIILLVDYHRLIIYDKLLPAGRLREPLSGKNRADIVIITKCPKSLNPIDYRVLSKAMELYPFQQLYFTTLDYCDLEPIFSKGRNIPLTEIRGKKYLVACWYHVTKAIGVGSKLFHRKQCTDNTIVPRPSCIHNKGYSSY